MIAVLGGSDEIRYAATMPTQIEATANAHDKPRAR
jgi:hypothetical protein